MVFENGVLLTEGNFMWKVLLPASVDLSGSVTASNMGNIWIYWCISFLKDLASISYYYDFPRKHIYSYNDIDIGLHPASGLKSPTVSEVEREEELPSTQYWIKHNQLLRTRNIAVKETKSLRRKACAIFHIWLYHDNS